MKKITPDSDNSWFGLAGRQFGAWEVESGKESFGSLWRAFMTARVTIASVLLVLQAAIYALGQPVRGGMVVLSQSEYDPDGPVCGKVVEGVFVREATTVDVRVAGAPKVSGLCW